MKIEKIHVASKVTNITTILTLNEIEDLMNLLYYAARDCPQTRVREKASYYHDLLYRLETAAIKTSRGEKYEDTV